MGNNLGRLVKFFPADVGLDPVPADSYALISSFIS